MIAKISSGNKEFLIDFSKPLDISIPVKAGLQTVNAFHIPPVEMRPFRIGNFIGDVNQGGACNVFNILFNPHGNGTHTETVGHISAKKYPISLLLNEFFFEARLISVTPEKSGADRVITTRHIESLIQQNCPPALIIRTLPNSPSKLTQHYSGTNPVYFEEEAARYLSELNVKHLILDVPSIDREEDGGKLSAHYAFWNYPAAPRLYCTITELAFIPDTIPDGDYVLNLMIAGFDNDASPSKPVLYAMQT